MSIRSKIYYSLIVAIWLLPFRASSQSIYESTCNATEARAGGIRLKYAALLRGRWQSEPINEEFTTDAEATFNVISGFFVQRKNSVCRDCCTTKIAVTRTLDFRNSSSLNVVDGTWDRSERVIESGENDRGDRWERSHNQAEVQCKPESAKYTQNVFTGTFTQIAWENGYCGLFFEMEVTGNGSQKLYNLKLLNDTTLAVTIDYKKILFRKD